MGPQPSSRGNFTIYCDRCGLRTASMGPQPSSRGNNEYTKVMTAEGRLQWGRNLPVAEIKPELVKQIGEALLQWGRNLPVAEIRRRALHRVRHEGASMGPQPSSRGNIIDEASSLVDRYVASMGPQPSSRGNRLIPSYLGKSGSCGLQWGRNLPVAEITTAAARTSPQWSCFNGAATFQSRK